MGVQASQPLQQGPPGVAGAFHPQLQAPHLRRLGAGLVPEFRQAGPQLVPLGNQAFPALRQGFHLDQGAMEPLLGLEQRFPARFDLAVNFLPLVMHNPRPLAQLLVPGPLAAQFTPSPVQLPVHLVQLALLPGPAFLGLLQRLAPGLVGLFQSRGFLFQRGQFQLQVPQFLGPLQHPGAVLIWTRPPQPVGPDPGAFRRHQGFASRQGAPPRQRLV